MLYTLWLWCAYIEEASVDVLVASHIGKKIRLWFYDTDRLWFLRCCFVFNTVTCYPMLLMMLNHHNNYIFWDHTRLKHDYIVIISSHTTCFLIMKDSGQLFFHPITKTVASSTKNWHVRRCSKQYFWRTLSWEGLMDTLLTDCAVLSFLCTLKGLLRLEDQRVERNEA